MTNLLLNSNNNIGGNTTNKAQHVSRSRLCWRPETEDYHSNSTWQNNTKWTNIMFIHVDPWPITKSDPFDQLTHEPSTCCLLSVIGVTLVQKSGSAALLFSSLLNQSVSWRSLKNGTSWSHELSPRVHIPGLHVIKAAWTRATIDWATAGASLSETLKVPQWGLPRTSVLIHKSSRNFCCEVHS